MTEMSTDPTTPSTATQAADLDLVELFRVQAGQHNAVRKALLPFTVECDEANCREANSHRDTCRCLCQGEGHGVRFRVTYAAGRERMAARIARNGGNPFYNLPAVDDEAW